MDRFNNVTANMDKQIILNMVDSLNKLAAHEDMKKELDKYIALFDEDTIKRIEHLILLLLVEPKEQLGIVVLAKKVIKIEIWIWFIHILFYVKHFPQK